MISKEQRQDYLNNYGFHSVAVMGDECIVLMSAKKCNTAMEYQREQRIYSLNGKLGWMVIGDGDHANFYRRKLEEEVDLRKLLTNRPMPMNKLRCRLQTLSDSASSSTSVFAMICAEYEPDKGLQLCQYGPAGQYRTFRLATFGPMQAELQRQFMREIYVRNRGDQGFSDVETLCFTLKCLCNAVGYHLSPFDMEMGIVGKNYPCFTLLGWQEKEKLLTDVASNLTDYQALLRYLF